MTRRHGRDQSGAAAVEFALVVPILLILVFGLIQYGLYFWALQGGADAARYAARLSAVGKPSTCSSLRSQVTSDIGPYVRGTPTITRSYAKAEGNTGSQVEIGDRVTVVVAFNSVDLNFPFIPFVNDGRVSESVQTRVDYVPAAPEACS
jgi:Flp pilus assembly protein TadG